MSVLLKIKFDPQRGGANSYDFVTPAFKISTWTTPVFSVLESSDDITYSPLNEGTDWLADMWWERGELHLHILKDYDQVVYFILGDAQIQNIPVAFNTESQHTRMVAAGWNTGEMQGQNIPAACNILGEKPHNIPAGFYEKFPNKRNIPLAYGVSGSVSRLITVSFNIGTQHSRVITAGAWLMGVAPMPSEALILPGDADPAASRVRGRTKEIILTGTEWEDLD